METTRFLLRKISCDRNYSAFGREILATYLSVKHFRYFVEGRTFFILTDHKPLTFALTSNGNAYTLREQRQLAFICEFTTDIRHIKGKHNVVADGLSPVDIAALMLPGVEQIDFSAIAKHQLQDNGHQGISLQLKETTIPHTDISLLCGFSTGTARPHIPSAFRKKIFDALHGLSHPGIRATQELINTRFI